MIYTFLIVLSDGSEQSLQFVAASDYHAQELALEKADELEQAIEEPQPA